MRASTLAEMDVSPLLINESPRIGLYEIGNEEDDFITAIDQLVCETNFKSCRQFGLGVRGRHGYRVKRRVRMTLV